jgi:hypothetical protein
MTKESIYGLVSDSIHVQDRANDSGGMHYGTQAHNSLSIIVEYFSRFPEHSKEVIINLKGCWDTDEKKPRCST